MIKIGWIVLIITASIFLVSACSSQNTSGPTTTLGSGNGLIATATPGTMLASPGSSHMMPPIGGENIQKATEKVGGQPLAFRMEGTVKIFQLTAKPIISPSPGCFGDRLDV